VVSLRQSAWLGAPIALAALVYLLWWRPKLLIDVEPSPLIYMLTAFWLTVIASASSLLMVKRLPRLVVASIALTALILAIPASTALTLTGLWLTGNAP